MILDEKFFKRDSLFVGPELLGKVLCRKIDGEIIKSRIVETESYAGFNDRASHSFNGRKTKRNEAMYLEGGHIYVYLSYGIHYMLNIITGDIDNGEGVLIRAVEPLNNIDEISINRFGKSYNKLTNYQKKNLTNGPGKLTKALDITIKDNKKNIRDQEIYIEDDGYSDFKIVFSKRVGIDSSGEAASYLYRYYINKNPYVSVK